MPSFESLTNREKAFVEKFKEFFTKDYIDLILNFNKLEASEYNNLVVSIKNYLNEVIKKKGKKEVKRWENISSSQLRNIFSKVKSTNDFIKIILIRPKLAYVGGRTDSKEVKEIAFLFEQLISKIDNNEKLQSFKDFFEAIIAYHKYFGGK